MPKEIEDKDFTSQESINLIHFMDLNIIELLILELLIRHEDPVVRYTLYHELDEFLGTFKKKLMFSNAEDLSETEKKLRKYNNKLLEKSKLLSPSSFYNSLNNLENRGFIRFYYNKKGKIKEIETTDLSNTLIEELGKYVVKLIGVSTDFDLVENLMEFLKKTFGKDYVESILIIWLPFLFDMRIIKRVRKLTEKLFLLSRIDDKEELEDRGLEDIEITQSYGNVIREPNNVFDIVVIPYLIDPAIEGLSIVDLLKEGYRIIKENGFLLTFIGRTPPRTKHRILNRIREIHNQAFEDGLFSKKEIINHLKHAEIKNYEFLKYGRQLILIIRKNVSSKK
ncbi:MAG: hypothetical protein BAJALOKI2v1_350041 [Promethearchaeota archaeon]|nr:MAG: hypothetical protein BAJALOKI2v1_350041 [Candidatus Lokiarchaeota archaeon]